MPKFAINIGSSFQPFSYEELALPLTQATTAYNELQDKYSDLTALSELYRQRALREQDSPWAQQFLEYADALQQGADELTKTGYSLNNRNLFSKLRGQYSTTVTPITKGLEREEQWAKSIATMDKSKRPIIGKMPSLQEFIDNPMASPNIINGADVETDAKEWAAALSSRMYSDALTATSHAAFVRAIQTNGMSPENIAMFMQSDEGQSLMSEILSKYDMSGMSPQQQQRILNEAISGAFKGFVYSENVSYQQDPIAIADAKEGVSSSSSKEEKNPYAGIIPEELISESDTKEAYERSKRFLSYVDEKGYNQNIRNQFIGRVQEAQEQTSKLAKLAKENKEKAIEEVTKFTKDKELATEIINKLQSNNWSTAAGILDRYYFFDSFKWGGVKPASNTNSALGLFGIYQFNDKPLQNSMIEELKSIFDSTTNRGALRVNAKQLASNQQASDKFFNNAIKIQGLEDVFKNPDLPAMAKFNKGQAYSMSIKESSKKQYADYILSQLDNGATVHGVSWDSKSKEWKKTGKEFGIKELVSEKTDESKFDPMSVVFTRSGKSGTLNAVVKCRIGTEIVNIELPVGSSLISTNISNAIENAYTLSDLIDPKKSAQAIKNLNLSTFADTFGEDSIEYRLIKAIKELGYMTPEAVAAVDRVYKAYILTAKNRIQDLGTPGLE